MKYLISFFVLFSTFLLAGVSDSSKVKSVLTNDSYHYISVNNIKMWLSNNGDGSHDPITDRSGFYWPKNETKSAIFEDGLIWGCKINGEFRVNGNTHRQGLQAGKILPNGQPDDPSLSKYKVYVIHKGWQTLPPGPDRDFYEECYNNWPVEDGAPWSDIDQDGQYTAGVDEPRFLGDETVWFVSNDMDPSRSTYTYGTMPIGLEVQTTVFASVDSLISDVVYKKYLVINKGVDTVKDMYLGYWSDTDLGDANDDYTGYDSTLNLGYTYNAVNNDGVYGTPPPAVGYKFLQTPITSGGASDSGYFNGEWRKGYKNLPMTGFTFYLNGIDPRYRDPQQGVIAGAVEFYNYLSGKVWDGQPFIDPNTGETVKLILSGDPVMHVGWYEGTGFPGGPPPGDRRHLMSTGTIDLLPGDSTEICLAILIARGSSNLNSITALKNLSQTASNYYGNFVTPTPVNNINSLNEFDFTLSQNYPNPFNPSTAIEYSIPEDGFVSLKIFDVLGREVATLFEGERRKGTYKADWNALSVNRQIASGIYLCRLEGRNFSKSIKMLLMK